MSHKSYVFVYYDCSRDIGPNVVKRVPYLIKDHYDVPFADVMEKLNCADCGSYQLILDEYGITRDDVYNYLDWLDALREEYLDKVTNRKGFVWVTTDDIGLPMHFCPIEINPEYFRTVANFIEHPDLHNMRQCCLEFSKDHDWTYRCIDHRPYY